MKIGSVVGLAGALWLLAAGAWGAELSPPIPAPTTITTACFSNACGAALAAAIKVGDPKAVLAAGGSADDVVTAAINAMTLAGGQVAGLSGPALLAQVKSGSAQLGALTKDGQPSATFEFQDGRGGLLTWATLGAPPKPMAVIYALPPGPKP